MILGVGTDIIEIERISKAVTSEHFLQRVYTAAEREYALQRGKQADASLAARFAAKEAVLKAFGTGLRQGTLLDIEVVNDELGCPHVRLSGYYEKLAAERGVQAIHLSLSHARQYATAVCVMEGRP